MPPTGPIWHCTPRERGGKAICARAAEQGFDLIVVGSHGRGLLARAFLGCVSSYVVHHAPCLVLVVRAETDDDE